MKILVFLIFCLCQIVNAQKIGDDLADLISKKEYKKAENKLENLLKKQSLDKAFVHMQLAHLALLKNQSRSFRTHILNIKDSPLAKNTALMAQIYQALPASDKSWFASELSKWGFFAPSIPGSCAFFELEKRKKRALLLADIEKNTSLSDKARQEIWRELYINLAESIEIASLGQTNKFIAWQKKLSSADFVERMANLMLFGKNQEAEQTYNKALEMGKTERCLLDYEFAKLERKKRRYKEARTLFQTLSARCEVDIKQKARFMNIQLAAMASDKSIFNAVDSFIADYPTHSFSDDVLLFKANILRDHKDYPQAMSVLESIVNLFPDGDMIFRALFLQAFMYAEQKNISAAEQKLRALQAKAPAESLEKAQADYWLARLWVFNDITSLKNPLKANYKKAKELLYPLVYAEVPTVYSWLAFELLREMGAIVERNKMLVAKHEDKKVLIQTPLLKLVKNLIDHNFKQESLFLLEEIALSSDHEDDIGAVAQMYQTLGRPEYGYQKLIRCDEKVRAKLIKHWPHSYQHIAWPEPFAKELQMALARVDVPAAVINSMMGHESGFFPTALSWAGAHGLLQLMPSTAEEHAKLLGLKENISSELFDAKTNLLIGSYVLFNYWQRFGHIAIALAAYNAGPTSARRWIKDQKDIPIDMFIEKIEFKETNFYVKKVLGTAFAYAIKKGVNQLPSLDLRAELGQ